MPIGMENPRRIRQYLRAQGEERIAGPVGRASI
jgi:hypothetical protein